MMNAAPAKTTAASSTVWRFMGWLLREYSEQSQSKFSESSRNAGNPDEISVAEPLAV
jgi:hypothetical protein